jgi:SET family sugar efflux transporter-like MFS transporter
MLPVLSFTLFHTAMFAGGIVLPLYVTKALGRPDRDVGLLFSVCAFAEIPAALALLLLPARISRARVILLGMALLVVYSVLIATTSSLPVLIGSQVARGVAIAVVGVLGITYFQDLMPEAAGRATTLYANTAAAGSLVSGVLAGTAAQLFGYRSALMLCGALGVIAVVLLKMSPSGEGREVPDNGRGVTP